MSRFPNLYPQAAQDGTPIPEEIANPQGYIVANPTGVIQRIDLPNESNILTIYSTDACIMLLEETNQYATDSYQPNGFLVLPNLVYTMFIARDFFRLQHIGQETEPQFFANVLTPWVVLDNK